MKKIIVFSLFILIFLTSCNNVSDFLFETEQNIEIRSIDNGFIYNGGESFPISISFDREIVPDLFTVAIFDDMGTSWGETAIEIPEVEQEYHTSLIIPDLLPQGKYIFHIRVFESEQEIYFKEITIFKTDFEYTIEQLYSMPHETKAGKDVLIKAVVQSPENIDPFLRWSLNNLILNEGYLSEGLDVLNWQAENDNGLYSIHLEVFPEFCDYSFNSSVFSTTEIVVSDQSINETDSFEPVEDYSLLYHFSGELNPVNESEFEINQTGLLILDSIDNIFGYTFSESNGISATGLILPEKSGKLTPFSINGRVALTGDFTAGNLISFESELHPLFDVSIDNSGNLLFTSGDIISRSAFSVHNITDFTLSIIPKESGIEVYWYYDGKNGGSDYLEIAIPDIGQEQTVLIGGSETGNSADMFLDELGVYVGDMDNSTTDANQFNRVKAYDLGENLLSAEGFDGQILPEVFTDFNNVLSVENGFLSVQKGSRVLLDTFTKSINDIEFIFSFPPVENGESGNIWKLYVTDEFDNELFSFNETDLVSETDVNTGFLTKKLRFSLITREDSVEIISRNNGFLNKVLNEIKPGELLTLFFETNVENNKESLLDFYIIFTNIDLIIPQMFVTERDVENLL